MGFMLKNRKYIGEYKYADVIVPGGMPAIIDDELFERVQKRMKVNHRAPARAKAKEEYLLTTKLFCGSCGKDSKHCGSYSYGNCDKRKQLL